MNLEYGLIYIDILAGVKSGEAGKVAQVKPTDYNENERFAPKSINSTGLASSLILKASKQYG